MTQKSGFTKSQLISPADGNVMETLTDPRVGMTVGGVVLGAFAERQLFINARTMFGIASPDGKGGIIHYAPKKDNLQEPDTAAGDKKQLRTNRNIARGVGAVGAIAAIEYTNSGEMQYALLGMASIWCAHIIQDFVPQLVREVK